MTAPSTEISTRSQFDFFSDQSHGWLRVPQPVVDAMGLRPSRFSYHHLGWAYLEEDCDASAFLEAWEAAHGSEPTVIERIPSVEDSHIRRYARFEGVA